MASIGPWAPPSVPVVPPAGGCGLNQTEATVFRPAPTKSVRATTADHSKPNLARLYGGARSNASGAPQSPLRYLSASRSPVWPALPGAPPGLFLCPGKRHPQSPAPERERAAAPPQDTQAAITILHVARQNGAAEHQAERVHNR